MRSFANLLFKKMATGESVLLDEIEFYRFSEAINTTFTTFVDGEVFNGAQDLYVTSHLPQMLATHTCPEAETSYDSTVRQS